MGVETVKLSDTEKKTHICALTHSEATYRFGLIGSTVIDIYPSAVCKLALSMVQSQLDSEAGRRR